MIQTDTKLILHNYIVNTYCVKQLGLQYHSGNFLKIKIKNKKNQILTLKEKEYITSTIYGDQMALVVTPISLLFWLFFK